MSSKQCWISEIVILYFQILIPFTSWRFPRKRINFKFVCYNVIMNDVTCPLGDNVITWKHPSVTGGHQRPVMGSCCRMNCCQVVCDLWRHNYLVSARHQLTPWRRPRGLNVILIQRHPAGCQLIDGRRGDLAAMVTDVMPAQVVSQNEDDMWGLGSRVAADGQQQTYRQATNKPGHDRQWKDWNHDVIILKRFPHYWPFVRGILRETHRSSVDRVGVRGIPSQKGQ